MELDQTWTWRTFSGYEKHLIMLLSHINIWFFRPRNIWPTEVEGGFIWTIPLNIINWTKEWGKILDMLMPYVTMKYNTKSSIKSSYVAEDIIMHKLPKDGTAKATWINTILKGRKQSIQETLHTFVTTFLLDLLINPSPVFNIMR